MYAVWLSKTGQQLATGGEDATVRVWDLTQGGPLSPVILRGHEGRVTGLAPSEDGKMLVSCSLDGTARKWDLDLESLHKKVRETAGRDLSETETLQYDVK